MNIRYRLSDIRALQNHILQRYFQMEIEANFTDKQWKDELLDILDYDQYHQHCASFTGVRHKINEKGIDAFTIDQMDTQLIVKLLQGENAFRDCCHCKLRWTLSNIQEDRNFEAHITSNESDEALFRWAVTTIQNLKKFVTVCGEWNTNSRLPNETRQKFCADAHLQLDEMADTLAADYKNYFHQYDEMTIPRKAKVEQEEKYSILAAVLSAVSAILSTAVIAATYNK